MARWLCVIVSVWLFIASSGSAHGQTVDLHGLIPPAPSSAWQGPVLTWSPQQETARSSYRFLFELADATAVARIDRGALPPRDVFLVTQLAALNLGGQLAAGPRWQVGGTLPVILTSASGSDDTGLVQRGPALGDLVVHASWGIVQAPFDDGMAVAVVPFTRLPIGSNRRSLGDPGFGAGALVAAGVGTPAFRADAHAGLAWRAQARLTAQALGGLVAPVAGSVGVRITDSVWLGAEVRGELTLQAQPDLAPTGVGTSPVEWFATIRARPSKGIGLQGAVGRGLTSGPGAAGIRAFLGVGSSTEAAASDRVITVLVTDPERAPVRGASVLVGELVTATTTADGTAVLPDPRWRRGVRVRADGFLTATVEEPPEGDRAEVQLEYAPAQVRLRVSSEEGAPVDATVTVTAADGAEVEGTPDDLALLPGSYQVDVSAPGTGRQQRRLVVAPRSVETAPFEVVLLPEEGSAEVALVIEDPDGQPVRDARVLVDGRPVGTTADGGVVRVAGVGDADHAVEITHPDYTTAVVEGVAADGQDRVIRLRREKGSVRVTVRNPEGEAVTDGIVRFLGPRRLPPVPLGGTGQRVQVLGPGTWTVLVTSQDYGVQERTVDVPPDDWSLIEVRMVLQPPEDGEAILTLRVLDPDGIPVDGADVSLDGRALGQTSTGGTIRVPGLAPGLRTLGLARPRMRVVEPLPIVLTAGTQERVVQMDWLPGQVDVRARTVDGPVTDGVIRFFGPEEVPPTPLGSEGTAAFTLGAGAWTLLVSSEALGIQQRTVEVPADGRARIVVDFELIPAEGGVSSLGVRVEDPEARPVNRAAISLDGVGVGATSNTGELTLTDLSSGTRTIDVSAPALATATATVALGDEPVTTVVRMDWATGAVRVRVRDAGGPVSDALVRFLGPQAPRPVPVDTQGAARSQLTPGTWVALATSESAGVGEIRFDVPDPPQLTDVTLELTPSVAGTADVAVRVVDPAGEPVSGAEVALGDRTRPGSSSGLAVFRDLAPGDWPLAVEAPGFEAVALSLSGVEPGLTEQVVTLAWTPTAVAVTTQLADGVPLAARVQPEGGPIDVVATETDADGRGSLSLVPGSWRLVATEGARAAEVPFEIRRGQRTAEAVLTLTSSAAQLEGRQVTIAERVQFDFDSAVLRADSGPVLDAVARVIRSAPQLVRIEVQGHTDNIGAVAVNQALSQRRAESVVAALVERGIAPEKLVPVGYGRSRPRAANDTADGRAENRRVQFEVREVSPED